MKFLFRTLIPTLLLLLVASQTLASPTPCGSTGLLNQPTAQTLNSGNICVGIWSDSSEWGPKSGTDGDATIVPFTITLGLGSFMEAYGSYPNLLFNDDETMSRRGYAILGTKLRLLGKRSSPVQFAIDGQLKRAISNDPDRDGLTDFLGRGILSFKTRQFGIHGWGGVLDLDDNPTAAPPIGPFEDVTGYGGGIEFFPTARLRIIAEAEVYSEAVKNTDDYGEWMAGIQYYISPHLTLSLGYGEGMTDLSPDSRILVGLSTCQGIGTYSQIEKKTLPPEEIAEESSKEPVKVLKIKTLSPLLTKPRAVEASPATQQQMPTDAGATEAIIDPAPPVIPIVPLPQLLEAAPASTAVEIPVVAQDAQEVILDPSQNIATADAYVQGIDKQPLSPIGAPAMAMKEDVVIDSPTKTKVYRRFLLPEFSFEVDQYSLTPEGSAALSMIAVELSRDNKWFAMRIDGHTDSTGSDNYNDNLSYERAVEYAMHLVAKNGVNPGRVFVKGFGESSPIAPNDSTEGRSQNRRVELLVLVPSE